MYQYKFVKVELKGILQSKPEEDYQEIIHQHAREGWRLFQIFAPNTYGFGTATFLELIFERSIMMNH